MDITFCNFLFLILIIFLGKIKLTDLIFFCTSLLLISTLLVIFLLRSSIFNKKVLIISISTSILTATIYIFKSDLKSFTYMNDLKNNIEQGNDINPNEVIVFLEKKT